MGCQYLYKGTWYTEDGLRELFSQRGVTSREMVFLRHGITDEDDAGENSGQNGETINERGYKETKDSLERDLKSENVEVVYTSPTKRARQTSQIISKDLNIPIIEVAGLEAWDIGKFSSRPEGDFDERFYLNNPDVKVPGGESFNQFKNRLMNAVDEIQHSAKKPAILTHSKSLKVLQALDKTGGVWNKEAIDEYFKEADPENKQVNKMNYYSSDEPNRKNINPSQASPATMKKVREFLDRIGVEVQSLAKITYDGQTLGVNGLADPLNGLIQIVQGKEDIALPEEAMHMAVELIEQKNPKLFKEMMDRIGRYNLTDQVFLEYQNNPFYQKDGKADINKIKKEAIGKVLAQTVIDRNQGAQEKPELLDQTRNWWQRIIDFLKDLFLKAGFNPFEQVAEKILGGEDFGTVQGLIGTPFASRNPNAINASLKLVSSLRDPRAEKWFKSLPRETFLTKLQQDLQAPKSQVDMLAKWLKDKNIDSISDMITGVLAELSYTVEVNVATDKYTETGLSAQDVTYATTQREREELEELGWVNIGENRYSPNPDLVSKNATPTQHYSSLSVPGGTNYRENEIKTPDITPSIKGHAAFSTDQGIGWFRSDDQAGTFYEEDAEVDIDGTKVKIEGGIRTTGKPEGRTRRILELQSDLFQKGRDKDTLVNTEGEPIEDFEEFAPGLVKGNDFLQLLNKENNWVTFFVKAIVQDSAKKGYENVRFPGGNTANKIEGQTTVEEFIATKQNRIDQLEELLAQAEKEVNIESFSYGSAAYYIESGKYYISFGDGSAPAEISQEDYREEYKTATDRRSETVNEYKGEIDQLTSEIEHARGPEGMGKFGAINRFYENTVHNILKKQGYSPKEVVDEYGNKWFEVKLEDKRDLGNFYFQISGPQDLAEKIVQKNANITKRGDEFEINGNKIKKNIQEQIQDFYRKRIGAERADKALKGFKQETENKVQVDIKDILNRYIDDDNKVRVTPLPQSNPSAVDPMDNSFYLTLESHIKERLDSYESGTQFVHSVNLYDGLNTAGQADLIAITPQGNVDILQFKVPQYSTTSPDVPVYRQEAYNIEIEALRKILQTGYGVNRSNFRQTRAIPIKAEYERLAPGISDMKLTKLTVGNVNVSLIQDDSLLPISSESEVSDNEQFDEFIGRLRALAQKIASERVSPEKRQERSARVAELMAAIRKLQIKRNGSGIISSGQALIKRSKERITALRDKVSNTDPDQATIAELNKIADDILSDKDQIQIYKDIYTIFKNTFTDGTVDSQEMVKNARNISDDANDLINDYWNLAVKFRTTKFAAKVGIKDEFTPEKRLTWYRRMVRSLSQSSIKAGDELWQLVKRINGGFKLEFLDRLDELGKIEKTVSEWMQGKSVQDLYKKIFKYDDKGRWTGGVIQKIDRKFYEDLKKAQESKDEKWIKDNIDIDEYKKWFVEAHQQRIDDAKTARIVADDAENQRLVQQGLQDFVDTFHIDFKRGIGTYNWALKNFPKVDKWKSDAYKEIENVEPLLNLYNYYAKRLKEAWNLGMIHEHNGWSWFPNVRRNLLEKLSTAPAGGKLQSLLGSVRIEAEDQEFGKIDPITGKPVDEIHANFVSDLFQYVQDADGNYFRDYSEKSMDIFKVIALWDAEIVKYKLRTESEGMARLLYYTELGRKAYESTTTGKLKKTPEGKPIPISNEVNAQYVKEHIDAVYYGKAKSDEFDVTITIPYKAAVERINKLFGSEILTVPEKSEIKISGIKVIGVMNRYFVTKTLGLNVMTSVAQLFGGTINTAINQGLYFNKKDMLEAELKYVSAKFYTNDYDKKLAALVGFFHPYLEDRTSAEIRKLSVSKMVEYLSSDHLFYLQRGSDNWVNTIVALAMFKNTMVDNGKLVNIRDFARKELGHANKYQGTFEESVEFDKRFEKRVEELQKSPQALVNYAQVVNDQITLPNIDRNGDVVINLRQQILEIIKDALGNTSHEDLSLYKRSIMWQSFFMFKNWIPRMFDVRFGSLKYSPGTDKYEYGRVRMLVNAVTHLGLSANAGLIAKLGNNPKPLVDVAKEQFAKKRAAFAEEMQDLDMTEAEFVDMYIKGVRSEMRELMMAAGLMGLLIAMRLSAPDKDDDEHTKGAYRWALRGLDKLTDELAFMYTPSSFTNILNGSVFPAVGILVEAERLFTSVIKKLFYEIRGDQEAADKQHPLKYIAKGLPIFKELITYLAVFNNDIAKEYGIRMNTNYGSVR